MSTNYCKELDGGLGGGGVPVHTVVKGVKRKKQQNIPLGVGIPSVC